MVAGFVKLHLKVDKIDDAIAYWNSRVEEAKKSDVSLQRLQGWVFAINRETGHGYSLGLWENEEDSKAFESSKLFAELRSEIEKFSLRPPVREQLDIVGGDLTRLRTENLAA